MLTSNLACGPMSREIIEAIFRYSHRHRKQLMLICSRHQIDINSGYIFTTRQYMKYIYKMKLKYSRSDVIICRDHCGPGFGVEKEYDLVATRKTIRCDLECGFDLIHIDLCLAKMSHEDRLHNTTELMKYAKEIRSDVMFEIGTDENVGVAEADVGRIVADIHVCQKIANPTFYVVQTGSLVREALNVGSFEVDKVRAMHKALHRCGTKLKEHNADYLTSSQLSRRSGIVDAVNIAPQLGVVQTSCVLCQALIYGINAQSFIYEIISGGKWRKWSNNCQNLQLCALVAGHYHFNGPAYKLFINKLSQKIDIQESIIDEITKVIEHYLFSLEERSCITQ